MIQEPLETVAFETFLEQDPLVQITDIQSLDGGVHVTEEVVVVVQPDLGESRGVDRDRV